MDLELTGRVAIVTGSSRGIGLATAEALLAEGCHVVGTSRTPPQRIPDGLVHLDGDMLDAQTPSRLVERAVSEFGRLDILVNNAGAGVLRAGYERTSEADWRWAWELLFLACVRMTNAALPALLDGGGGAVVNISSRNARVPVPAVPDYSAAKAALNNYAKGVARQFARQGLRVTTVSPGPVATPLWLGPDGVAAQDAAMHGSDRDQVVRDAEAGMPAGRFATAAEVADLVVFLASARATMISGVDILLDGGLTQTL